MPLFYEYYLLIILKIQLIPFEIKPKTLIIMKLITFRLRNKNIFHSCTYSTTDVLNDSVRIFSDHNGEKSCGRVV